MPTYRFTQGRGAGNRLSDSQARASKQLAASSHATGSVLPVQAQVYVAPHYPFQPLPMPSGPRPYRFDLSELLSQAEVEAIALSGKMAFHAVGDTGDERGTQMDFVAAMLTQDYDRSPSGEAPAFFYHLGDVVYFAGDIDKYASTFYETYAGYPGLIVSIPGNHDCQPDDPQDGPVDPNKKPLDGWIQNFMSQDPTRLGSLQTNSQRTQMNLPNVYWTFTTPLATVIGLFSNVGEMEAEVHQDQIDWFRGELTAADKTKALIVAIHHPPYSGDDEHSGSAVSEQVLFESFAATGVYPHLVMSGHVHNYQRFTVEQTLPSKAIDIVCMVAGNGGYTKLGKLKMISGAYPTPPLQLTSSLRLEQYDQENFGFVRIEVTRNELIATYYSALFQVSTSPASQPLDKFSINLASRKVQTLK